MVAQCMQDDVSLASLAVEHGMNPNVLHRWVTEHERYGHHILSDDDRQEQSLTPLVVPTPHSATRFLPVPLSPSQSPAGNEIIRLEVKRGTTTVCVSWPVSAAAQCADLMREWLR
jgi:transposase-like protein